jgi:hypothetical protein
MFAFLWVAGVVVTLAGLALVATGALPLDAAFDSGTLTAGTIAAVGGLLLIGIGVTVRELRRIEQVIASVRRPRAAHVDEDQATDFVEAPSQLRVPLPAKLGFTTTQAATFRHATEAKRSRLSPKVMPQLCRGCRFVPRTFENVAIPPPKAILETAPRLLVQ